jgi:hypothetical protein
VATVQDAERCFSRGGVFYVLKHEIENDHGIKPLP